MYRSLALLSVLAAKACAQQAGTLTTETHPSLPMQSCSAGGTCTTLSTKIVLDANWRWLHSTSGSTNCFTGNTWDATLCPDGVSCAANCALDGADYSGVYGITTSGNALKMNFVTKGANTNVGSRVYLMDTTDTTYKLFKVLGQEFTFDVDVSNLPCGLNGALYFSEMQADGGSSEYPTNKAGSKYGTGYCDAQCPRDIKFISGQANSVGWDVSATDANSGTGQYGSCCNEMDIWEANSVAAAYTPHDCSVAGPFRCTGTTCTSTCDQAGCDFNSYRMGATSFYGPGKTVDTTKKFTVVTQFITNDGTATGTLTSIKRFYVQNGVVIPNSETNIPGITATNAISDTFCAQQKAAFGDTNTFAAKGGLAGMGAALGRGMVLVLSVWDDHSVNMLWLDSTYPTDGTSAGDARGSCAITSGAPTDVETNSPGASVTYSNIKIGPIGSTYSGTSAVSSSSAVSSTSSKTSSTSSTAVKTSTSSSTKTTTTMTTSVKATTTSSAARTTTTSASGGSGGTVPKWGQCAGQGWTGGTVCASGSTCTFGNPYYSQCL